MKTQQIKVINSNCSKLKCQRVSGKEGILVNRTKDNV